MLQHNSNIYVSFLKEHPLKWSENVFIHNECLQINAWQGIPYFQLFIILLNYAPAETGKCCREKWLGEAEHLLQGTIVNTIKKLPVPQ